MNPIKNAIKMFKYIVSVVASCIKANSNCLLRFICYCYNYLFCTRNNLITSIKDNTKLSILLICKYMYLNVRRQKDNPSSYNNNAKSDKMKHFITVIK